MDIREKIIRFVDENAPVYEQIALDIHARPEVSNYEFFACERHSEQLKKAGFDVKVDVAGHRTGFTACYKSGKPGPVIMFPAEFDALNGIGHACGHNLYGATSSLAGTALKQVIDEFGGEVRIYGTPGEEGGENGSAKGSFVREGFLKDVDAALSVHPVCGPSKLTGKSLVCAPIDIEFWGKPAHAARAPEQGINALDALILTYNGLNALRQHVPAGVQIHGIIVNGGDAPNIVPEYAKAKFYLRSANVPQMDALWPRVEAIVQGAALMTGAKGRMQPSQNRVENTVPTPSFDEVFRGVMETLGETFVPSTKEDEFISTDCGNFSQVVPTIQPYIRISEDVRPCHSEGFRDAACSRMGLDTIALCAKGLALTAVELIKDPALLASIKAEHAECVKHQND